MSKTFKSIHNDLHDMEVDTHPDGSVRFSVDADHYVGFCVAPSDAPALALAILEAAGVEHAPMMIANNLEVAFNALSEEVAKQERATAEARERAELEAEALELFNVNQGINLPDWGKADRAVISSWVRVARRARELAKEATK